MLGSKTFKRKRKHDDLFFLFFKNNFMVLKGLKINDGLSPKNLFMFLETDN